MFPSVVSRDEMAMNRVHIVSHSRTGGNMKDAMRVFSYNLGMIQNTSDIL